MATLKQLRTRIKSLSATHKITSAMKLVATAKWRRSRVDWEPLKDYITSIKAELAPIINPYLQKLGEPKKHILIICAPHKGLCGGYPQYITNAALNVIKNNSVNRIFITTEKGLSLLKKNQPKLDIQKIEAEQLDAHIHNGIQENARITIVHGVSKNVMTQEAQVTELWPYVSPNITCDLSMNFDGDSDDLALDILQHLLKVEWKSVMLGSLVAEEAARMNAMDHATRNANDFIETLNQKYNRLRQDRITTELIEMISGSAVR